MASQIYSVADNTIQAAFPSMGSDVPDGGRIGQTTNFEFTSRPAISDIWTSCSSCQYTKDNSFTVNLNFTESVDILDTSALKLHFKDDYGTDLFVDVDPASDNNTTQIWFNVVVPDNFYTNDLDVFDVVGLETQIRSVNGGIAPSPLVPTGTSDYRALAADHDIKLYPGSPYVVNVTSSNLDGSGNVYDLGQTVTVDVVFSEDVTSSAFSQIKLDFQNDLGGTHQVVANQTSAEDGDNIISFEFVVPANFQSNDLRIAFPSGIDAFVESVKSGINASTGGPVFPMGDANPNSLKSNKNLHIGNDPNVVSVSSAIADGAANKITTITDIDIVVTYDQSVDITGTPRLRFKDNSAGFFYGVYLAGSGTPNITYRVSVDPSNITTSDFRVDGFELNAGTLISSSNGLNYNELFPVGSDPRSLQSNKNIFIGANPTVVNITSNAPQGVLNAISEGDAGSAFKITVTFSEAVNIIDGQEANVFLSFLMDDNVTYYNAVLDGASDNNNNQLVFDFVPPAGLTTDDLEIDTFHGVQDFSYIEAAASPGTYVAAASVPKYEDVNSLESTGDIVIGDPPVLNSFFVAPGPYAIDDNIVINLNFANNIAIDEPVNGSNVQLKFLDADLNPVYAFLDPASMNGDATAIFNFLVPANMNTLDLTIVEAIGLEHIVDQKTEIPYSNASLPINGVVGSLADTYDIVVGGPAPNVVDMTTGLINGTYYSGDTFQISVTFDLPVSVDGGNGNFVKLKLAGDNGAFAFADLDNPCCNSGNGTLYFNFNVPTDGFETTDLQVVDVMGAEFIVNAASGIGLDNALIDFTASNPNSFVSNKDIQIASLPKVISIEPLNGTFFQAPTQIGEELRIAVNFSGPVEIPTNQGSVQIELADQNNMYSYAVLDATSLADANPNQIIFEATFNANFQTNDLRVNSILSMFEIKAEGTTESVDPGYPVGNQAGSLQNDHNVVVDNSYEVINVTSDEDDSVNPFPNESLLVKVEFNAPVTVQTANVMMPRLQAMGDNGSFAIAHIHEPSGYTNTNILVFEFQFPQEFQTSDLMISSAFDFFHIEKGLSNLSADIFDIPRNGGPNSLAANKNFVIEQKDPMTRYGSGVDGDLIIDEPGEVILSDRSDLIFDKDGQPKFASSFFKVRGIQYKTTPEPHHEIVIDGAIGFDYRQFFQADGTPGTETTLERDDILMWYIASEHNGGCGAQLSPGMFGFLAAAEILSTTRGAFAAPPGLGVSVMGGAFLPTSGLPTDQNLFNRSQEMDASLNILPHCNMQMVRVLMPNNLQIGTSTSLSNAFYFNHEVGGLLPIKVKENLDLLGSAGATPQLSMTSGGFASVGFFGFNGMSGSHQNQLPTVDQTAGTTDGDPAQEFGGGGAGYFSGGSAEGTTQAFGLSPAVLYCGGDCFTNGPNQMKHGFLGSAGAGLPDASMGGGFVLLHAKSVSNGTLSVSTDGDIFEGGGAGGGTVYLDFESINPESDPTKDVSLNISARGADGIKGLGGTSPFDSGGGGGGLIVVNVCSNNNQNAESHIFDVDGGISATGSPGDPGMLFDGTNNGPECINTLAE